MKAHKRFIYKYLKMLAKAALWVYFKKRTIVGKENMQQEGATILISNHPNTLMDPINVAVKTRMYVHFLANAGLFVTKIGNWFFNTFYCIPIKRKEDKPLPYVNNENSFERCNEFLAQGGCLFIAPEGTSWMDRMMRPFKTGTARIAFGAAAEQDFNLDLYIQPVGVTYTAPDRFRSRVFVHIGEPIPIKEYQQEYELDPVAAVKALTEQMEEQIRTMIIDTKDEQEDNLIKRLEEMLQNRHYVDHYHHVKRTQQLIEALRQLKEQDEAAFLQFEENVSHYFEKIQQEATTDIAVARKGKQNWARQLLGLPLFLYGAINNALPAFLTWQIVKKMKLYIGYNTTAYIILGLILVPLFYTLQTWLVHSFFGWYIAIAYLISLLPAGIFAADHWKYVVIFWKTHFYNKLEDHVQAGLQKDAKEIMEQLQQFNIGRVNNI